MNLTYTEMNSNCHYNAWLLHRDVLDAMDQNDYEIAHDPGNERYIAAMVDHFHTYVALMYDEYYDNHQD